MRAQKTANRVIIEVVDTSFGVRVSLVIVQFGRNAFLQYDLVKHSAIFFFAHLLSGFTIEAIKILNRKDFHHRHAIGSLIGFDDHKGRV